MPAAELLLIRHAPVALPGRLCGRTDPEAAVDARSAAALAQRLGPVAAVVASPARRCVATATALWPGATVEHDARLWEQDFGTMDGAALADLPDLGPLTLANLAAHRWPGGESFAEMAARVTPALADLSRRDGPIAVVAHAGTVRAALALALGAVPTALAFEVAPLSVTRLLAHPGGYAIRCVNWTP